MSKGAQTKEKIIETSLHLFSVKGYYNTSINDILEATQLTKGGLYGHFKSKDELWQAAYDRAVEIWKKIVFSNLKKEKNPIKRIEKALSNDLKKYLGADVFKGGCFFLNMMVELSGQSRQKANTVQRGILGFSYVLDSWLSEAEEKKMIKPGVTVEDLSRFIVITLNGCAALYAATRDKRIIDITLSQLFNYLASLQN